MKYILRFVGTIFIALIIIYHWYISDTTRFYALIHRPYPLDQMGSGMYGTVADLMGFLWGLTLIAWSFQPVTLVHHVRRTWFIVLRMVMTIVSILVLLLILRLLSM